MGLVEHSQLIAFVKVYCTLSVVLLLTLAKLRIEEGFVDEIRTFCLGVILTIFKNAFIPAKPKVHNGIGNNPILQVLERGKCPQWAVKRCFLHVYPRFIADNGCPSHVTKRYDIRGFNRIFGKLVDKKFM